MGSRSGQKKGEPTHWGVTDKMGQMTPRNDMGDEPMRAQGSNGQMTNSNAGFLAATIGLPQNPALGRLFKPPKVREL